jgi:nitrogen fixation-related uncharacterized protein
VIQVARDNSITAILLVGMIIMGLLYSNQRSQFYDLKMKQDKMLLEAVEKDRVLEKKQADELHKLRKLSEELSNALENKDTICLSPRDTDSLKRLWGEPKRKK